MASFSHGISGALRRVLIFTFLFFYPQTAGAAPSITVTTSAAGQTLTVTITGSGFPAAKSITFTCSYDAPQYSIMDAIVGSPLPSTAFSVVVDTAKRVLTIAIAAASTITVPDGSSLVNLQVPCAQQGAAAPFAVTKAAITGADGTVIEASIHPTAAIEPVVSHLPVSAGVRRGAVTRHFQLNGRCMAAGHTRGVSGCRVGRAGGAATSSAIILQNVQQR